MGGIIALYVAMGVGLVYAGITLYLARGWF